MNAETSFVRGGQVRSADDTRISYLVRGNGPLIVAIHGGLGTALSLMPLAEHLAGDFTVVVLNLRGHGTSETSRSEPHIDRYVEDVWAVIEAVGPIDALFGYSFGAVVAVETALAAGDLIRKLVVYEPPLPATYPIPDEKWLASMIRGGRYEELILQALSQGGGGLSAAEMAAARDNPLWLSNVAHAPTLLPTMKVLSALPPTVDRYASIATPTMLMLGTTSAGYLHRAGELLACVLPAVTTHRLDGQGHHFDPAMVADVVVAFVRP
jgi:pimeloyl-ACP methyl ester carboxylesterase